MLKVKINGNYDKMRRELIDQNPCLKETINAKVKLFMHNPDDTRLFNHPLTGVMDGQHAFSITDDIRIVYEWFGKNTVRFLGIGGHPKVYSRN